MNITDEVFATDPPSERSHNLATIVYAVILVATIALTLLVGVPS